MTPELSVESIYVSETANPGRAYVTFLAGNGDYVKGVVGLAKGLRKAKSAYPLVVAMLPDVPTQNYEFGTKMVYLDADIQVFHNTDELFDTPDGYLYGAFSCYCAKIWSHITMHSIGYCQYCPEKVPAEMETSLPPPYFNGGMFVFEPNPLTYESLLRTLQVTPATPFAEQDFLNMFFEKVFKPISPVYNLVLAVVWNHPGLVDLERVKVVHYCINGSKPWKYTGEEPNMDREDVKMLVKKWWDIYNDESLNFKPKSPEDLEEILSASSSPPLPEPSASSSRPPSAHDKS